MVMEDTSANMTFFQMLLKTKKPTKTLNKFVSFVPLPVILSKYVVIIDKRIQDLLGAGLFFVFVAPATQLNIIFNLLLLVYLSL